MNNPLTVKLFCIREATNEVANSPQVIVELMKEEAKADRECLWVLHLNNKMQIIEKELVSMGDLNCSIASPREIFKKAVINSAASIVVVHNHSSGDPKPSSDDRVVYHRLEKVGEILDIKVKDFIILGANGNYWSAKKSE